MSMYKQVDAYLLEYIKKWEIVGLSVAIVRNGILAYSQGYGVQNRENKIPVTCQSLFHIASVAKTMTSSAIMQLAEAGKLQLDDAIIKHVPSFCVDDPRSELITIRQCLCHTSGIDHPEEYGWGEPEFDDESLARHVRTLATHKLKEIEPNQTSYSDIAYNVLGHLIAVVSEMSYEEYMKQYIFDPLGMTTTTLMAPRAEHPEQVVTGYQRPGETLADFGEIEQSLYPYNRMHVPCGCIASSADEMARWMLACLNRGSLDGAQILQPASFDTMWTMQFRSKFEDATDDPALGWWVNRRYSEKVMEHDGGDDGFLSNLRLWTESGVGIVILCNSMWCDPWNATDDVYKLL
jgi:CubicO group peptidase (beta-lactamase class C family)